MRPTDGFEPLFRHLDIVVVHKTQTHASQQYLSRDLVLDLIREAESGEVWLLGDFIETWRTSAAPVLVVLVSDVLVNFLTELNW
jgi:hypothetical protein